MEIINKTFEYPSYIHSEAQELIELIVHMENIREGLVEILQDGHKEDPSADYPKTSAENEELFKEQYKAIKEAIMASRKSLCFQIDIDDFWEDSWSITL
jgi:hypothetical protein